MILADVPVDFLTPLDFYLMVGEEDVSGFQGRYCWMPLEYTADNPDTAGICADTLWSEEIAERLIL